MDDQNVKPGMDMSPGFVFKQIKLIKNGVFTS